MYKLFAKLILHYLDGPQSPFKVGVVSFLHTVFIFQEAMALFWLHMLPSGIIKSMRRSQLSQFWGSAPHHVGVSIHNVFGRSMTALYRRLMNCILLESFVQSISQKYIELFSVAQQGRVFLLYMQLGPDLAAYIL